MSCNPKYLKFISDCGKQLKEFNFFYMCLDTIDPISDPEPEKIETATPTMDDFAPHLEQNRQFLSGCFYYKLLDF